jgi:putative restriction endonuclease
MVTDLELKSLIENNYVRKAKQKNNYWFDLFLGKIDDYKKRLGLNFNIVIYDDSNKFDFYIIPFVLLQPLLIPENMIIDKRNNKRWVGSILNHSFKIRNCATPVDVSSFYGNPDLISKNELPIAETNEYAIANRLMEVNIRLKQSTFRKKVLDNFNEQCCLTGIKEKNLLVASHIIPWSEKVESRLDPANGLCLFVTEDKLFDQGYITFNNQLEIITTSKKDILSSELSRILFLLDGKKAANPFKYKIKNEYLEYHRDTIFMR